MNKLMMLVVAVALVGCMNEPSTHGKVVGSSHGQYFAPAEPNAPPNGLPGSSHGSFVRPVTTPGCTPCHRPTSHGGEF